MVLSNGQVLISGNPYIQIADKDLYQRWNEIEKTATGENAMKYVKALPSRVVLEIDNELIQGATLELEYTISVKMIQNWIMNIVLIQTITIMEPNYQGKN